MYEWLVHASRFSIEDQLSKVGAIMVNEGMMPAVEEGEPQRFVAPTSLGAEFQARAERIPVGRFDVIPSSVTGAPLRYFTPDSLPTLLSRYGTVRGKAGESSPGLAVSLALLGAAAVDTSGRIDSNYVALLGDVLFGRTQCFDVPSVVELGGRVSPRASRVRREIVFAGGEAASAAPLVFPHYESLPVLLSSLVEGLRGPPQGLDATIFSAIVGFYGVHVHPFIDGNGRWSRALALQAASTMGRYRSGMITAVFQNRCRYLLANHVHPHARSNGLALYLAIVVDFERAFIENLDAMAIEVSQASLAVLARHITGKKNYESLAVSMFTNEKAFASGVASLNLSAKRVSWINDELEEIRRVRGIGVNLVQFVAASTSSAIERAVCHIQKEFK